MNRAPITRLADGRPRLLVSVRDVAEALEAAEAGADIIDLKEPRSGALGAVPLADVREVVACLRRADHAQPVSATVGDWSPTEIDAVLAVARAVAACGVDYVKVGIDMRVRDAAPDCVRLLRRLAQALPHRVVPVLLADAGLIAEVVDEAAVLPFGAAMLDTADKSSGSLFDCVDDAALRGFVRTLRAAGRPVGLAGSLRLEHGPRLRALAPDIAGFRGAVTGAGRTARLQPALVRRLCDALDRAAPIPVVARP